MELHARSEDLQKETPNRVVQGAAWSKRANMARAHHARVGNDAVDLLAFGSSSCQERGRTSTIPSFHDSCSKAKLNRKIDNTIGLIVRYHKRQRNWRTRTVHGEATCKFDIWRNRALEGCRSFGTRRAVMRIASPLSFMLETRSGLGTDSLAT